MGKKRHISIDKGTTDALLAALQHRAFTRAAEYGHLLGQWMFAKRRFGKGAQKAICVSCGEMAVVLPNGNAQAPIKSASYKLPGALGETLFALCKKTSIPLIDATIMGSSTTTRRLLGPPMGD